MTSKNPKETGGSERLEGVLNLDLLALNVGDKVKLAGGEISEVVDNPRDGMWILLRFLDVPADPARVGEEELIFWADVLELLP